MTTAYSPLLLTLCLTALAAPAAAQELATSSDHRGLPTVSIDRQQSGRVQVDAGHYRAAFDREFVSLTTPSAAENLPDARLELRYLGHRRGLSTVDAAAVPPERTEQWVRFRRFGVDETYEVKANGFEQSFHFAQRPQGEGELVLSIAADGNLTADAVAPRHQALEFRQGPIHIVRYGEAFALDRSGRRIEVETAYDGHGRIELIVPAWFVDTASYPLVVDPAVGPIFYPPQASGDDTHPDVAYDLVNDRYMMVWETQYPTQSVEIHGRIFDGEGNPLTPDIIIAPFFVATRPAIALCNSLSNPAFLVAWSDGTRIRGRLYDSMTGNALGGSFVVSDPAPGTVDQRPCVAGPGNPEMVIAWDRTPMGASNAKEIVMRDLYWQFPTIPGSLTKGPERVLDFVTGGYVQNVKLGRSDARIQVGGQNWFANRAVWEQWWTGPGLGDFDVKTCSFRVRPVPFDFALIEGVTTVAGGLANDQKPDIGSRADLHQNGANMQFCIAWEHDGDVRARMYGLNGMTGLTFPVRATANYEGGVAVGAGYCEFTIAYLQSVPGFEFDLDVRAARVLLNGTVAIDNRLVDDPGTVFQSSLSASSRPIHTQNEQQTNTTLLAWMGRTGGFGANGNDVRARFFEPCAPNVSPFGAACPGPLGELPQIGTSGGDPIPGNEDFAFTMAAAPINSLAVLVASNVLTTTPVPGAPNCFLYAGVPLLTILPTVTNAVGASSIAVPIPCSVPSGTSLAFQWAVYSPTANAFGWITSNDLDVSWNH